MSLSRPFARNTGSEISGTLQIGNLAIGTPSSGFESTGLKWWNGPDENLGYVIAYEDFPGGRPGADDTTAYLGFSRTNSKSDVEFLNLAQTLAKTTFGTPNEAKSWLNDNGFWTSFPEFAASLLVYLDSGNSFSYPGSGSTWSDLTLNDNHATLINTPAYSSLDSGILQFSDSSSQYGTIPDLGNLSQWTVEVWFRLSSPLSGKVTSIVSNEFDLVDRLNFSIGTNNAPVNTNLSVGFYDGSWRTTTGFVPDVDTWYQVVGTYDGSVIRQYVNGTASGGTVDYVGTPESGGEVRLMRRWDGLATEENLVDGDLSIIKIYNSALTSGDILESYNLTKNRFSVVLYYDPGDSNSYPGSGTTLFSLVTPQYNGTLFNSPTYEATGGGSFQFNGTDQYIGTPHNPALKPTSQITIEQWLSADDWNAGTMSDYKTSISCTQGGGYAHYIWEGTWKSYVRANGSYQIPTVDVSSLTEWHHFVTTFDGRYTRLYLDGGLVDSIDIGTSGNPIQYSFNNSVLIGAEASGTTTPEGQYWDGYISITRIYNLALSSSEVLEKFNSEKSRFGL